MAGGMAALPENLGFPTLTGWLTIICNFSSGGSSILFGPPGAPGTQTHTSCCSACVHTLNYKAVSRSSAAVSEDYSANKIWSRQVCAASAVPTSQMALSPPSSSH